MGRWHRHAAQGVHHARVELRNVAEWRELWKTYSAAEIKDAVTNPLRGAWTRHGKAFAEIVCDRAMPDDVLISYDV